MKKDITEIVFILDRSGSMYELTKDTVDGFNSFIDKQQREVGDAFLTTILFDNEYEILHDRVDIKKVSKLTDEYYARGTTALLDAIGFTIVNMKKRLSSLKKSHKPNVLFFITTDGYENASKEYTVEMIKEMIAEQSKKGWNFIFLGANMDAVSVSNTYGIQMSATYSSSSLGTRSVYDTINSVTSSMRTAGNIDPNWNEKIE